MGHSFPQRNLPHLRRPGIQPHHIFTSLYPYSNGNAENAVKMVKRLQYIHKVPWIRSIRVFGTLRMAQRTQWRNWKQPSSSWAGVVRQWYQQQSHCFSADSDVQAHQIQQQCQKVHYNRQAMTLRTIVPGEIERMCLSRQTTWNAGVCAGLVGPRSYEVRIGDNVYRCNKHQLLHAYEPP